MIDAQILFGNISDKTVFTILRVSLENEPIINFDLDRLKSNWDLLKMKNIEGLWKLNSYLANRIRRKIYLQIDGGDGIWVLNDAMLLTSSLENKSAILNFHSVTYQT